VGSSLHTSQADLFDVKKIFVVERHGMAVDWSVVIDRSIVLHVRTNRKRYRPYLQVIIMLLINN